MMSARSAPGLVIGVKWRGALARFNSATTSPTASPPQSKQGARGSAICIRSKAHSSPVVLSTATATTAHSAAAPPAARAALAPHAERVMASTRSGAKRLRRTAALDARALWRIGAGSLRLSTNSKLRWEC